MGEPTTGNHKGAKTTTSYIGSAKRIREATQRMSRHPGTGKRTPRQQHTHMATQTDLGWETMDEPDTWHNKWGPTQHQQHLERQNNIGWETTSAHNTVHKKGPETAT